REAWHRYREATQRAARRLARDIARNLETDGGVTVIYPGRILWIESASSRRPDIIRQAITSAAGLLELVGQTENQPNGPAAFRQARNRGFFGTDLSHGLPAESRSIPQRAQAAFLELFPNGLVWTPGGLPAGLMHLSRAQTRNLIVGASIFARDLYPGRS